MMSWMFGAEDPPPEKRDSTSREDVARDAAEFLSRIEQLESSGEYGWASTTITGIYETVERTGRVTDGQRRAIDNIEASGQRREARPRRRRW